MDLLSTKVDFTPLVMVLLTCIAIPLATYFVKLAIAEVANLLKPYIGDAQAMVLQQRLDALLDKGIGEASLHYLPQLQAMGLTVDVGNLIAARVASYAVNHAPDLTDRARAFEGGLEEKVRARLVAHPAVQAAVNLPGAPLDVRPPVQAAA